MRAKQVDEVWTTKDGSRIRVCNMEDFHLLSTIKLLQRYAEVKRINTVNFYVNGPSPTGDMAQYCFKQEFDLVMNSTYEDYLPSIYENLLEEAKRRGLEIPEQPHRVDLEVKLVSETLTIKDRE